MKDSNEAKTKLPTETGFTASAGSVSWEDCERKFREMTAAFGKDMPKYRKLGAEYDAMLDAYERAQETPNVCVSDGPADAHKSTSSAEGPFAARNG